MIATASLEGCVSADTSGEMVDLVKAGISEVVKLSWRAFCVIGTTTYFVTTATSSVAIESLIQR